MSVVSFAASVNYNYNDRNVCLAAILLMVTFTANECFFFCYNNKRKEKNNQKCETLHDTTTNGF